MCCLNAYRTFGWRDEPKRRPAKSSLDAKTLQVEKPLPLFHSGNLASSSTRLVAVRISIGGETEAVKRKSMDFRQWDVPRNSGEGQHRLRENYGADGEVTAGESKHVRLARISHRAYWMDQQAFRQRARILPLDQDRQTLRLPPAGHIESSRPPLQDKPLMLSTSLWPKFTPIATNRGVSSTWSPSTLPAWSVRSRLTAWRVYARGDVEICCCAAFGQVLKLETEIPEVSRMTMHWSAVKTPSPSRRRSRC